MCSNFFLAASDTASFTAAAPSPVAPDTVTTFRTTASNSADSRNHDKSSSTLVVLSAYVCTSTMGAPGASDVTFFTCHRTRRCDSTSNGFHITQYTASAINKNGCVAKYTFWPPQSVTVHCSGASGGPPGRSHVAGMEKEATRSAVKQLATTAVQFARRETNSSRRRVSAT